MRKDVTWDPLYVCSHVDDGTECYRHGCRIIGKGLWSLQGKSNSCTHNMPCFAPHRQFTQRKPLVFFSFDHFLMVRFEKLDSGQSCNFSPPTPSLHLLCCLFNICSRPERLEEGTTPGKPTVLLFTFHPLSPLTHGCYRSKLSTNQLSTHICPMSTVCL